MNIDNAIQAIREELESATEKFGPFVTLHEGYAVILEELDELWDAIKTKGTPIECLEKEAIQVGAMALMFLVDLLPED